MQRKAKVSGYLKSSRILTGRVAAPFHRRSEVREQFAPLAELSQHQENPPWLKTPNTRSRRHRVVTEYESAESKGEGYIVRPRAGFDSEHSGQSRGRLAEPPNLAQSPVV